MRTTKVCNLLSHPFRDEAIAWLCTRRGEISATTYQTYIVHVSSLERFFKNGDFETSGRRTFAHTRSSAWASLKRRSSTRSLACFGNARSRWPLGWDS